MVSDLMSLMQNKFPRTAKFIGEGVLEKIEELKDGNEDLFGRIQKTLKRLSDEGRVEGFVPDLARLENELNLVKGSPTPCKSDEVIINPTTRVVPVSFKGLTGFFDEDEGGTPFRVTGEITKEEGFVIIWKDTESGQVRMKEADEADLLSLKIVAEGIEPLDLSRQTEVPLRVIERAMELSYERQILLKPESRIKRVINAGYESETTQTAQVFTLQWHITQACDLHCRHCYDRSTRSSMSMKQAIKVLDDMYIFCKNHFVHGQITFTGGNPFLYPNFYELYREASDRGFMLAIAGNPVKREMLERIIEIQMPEFYQVSLEGLKENNDYIRGQGHYQRTIEFLKLLKDLGIPSAVMLTLSSFNINDIISLAKELSGLTDYFTFNRLCQFGEAKYMQMAERDSFRRFLREYIDASKEIEILGLKDNLLNVELYSQGLELSGGCTGFGCGAAFNFVSVLSDGQVHACRKFPSLIGNIFEESLDEIYHCEEAELYRQGPRECVGCPLSPVCRGCPGVTASLGLDFSEMKDPYCFFSHHTVV